MPCWPRNEDAVPARDASRGKGCEEHHRRCREWPRNAHAYHAGSVITAVSSQFDLVAADLSSYENVIVSLREIDLEMEEASDDLPRDSLSRSNPRYDAAARARDLDDERNHLAKLATMLQRHAEVADRLQELHEEEDEQAEAEDVFDLEYITRHSPQAPATAADELTATQTARHLISMFQVSPGRVEPRDAMDEQPGSDPDDRSIPHSQWSYELDHLAGHSQPSTGTVDTEARDPTDQPVSGGERLIQLEDQPVSSSVATWSQASTRDAAVSPMMTTSATRTQGIGDVSWSNPLLPRVPMPQNVRGGMPRLPSVILPGGAFSQPRVRMTAARQVSQWGSGPRLSRFRRRSRSNEFGQDGRTSTGEGAMCARREDRLFELATKIRTRQNMVSARLSSLEAVVERTEDAPSVDQSWICGEERTVLTDLEVAESAEAEVWTLTAALHGPEERSRRAAQWADWHLRVMTRLIAIKRSGAPPVRSAHPVVTEAHSCARRGGFLERVKLPTFSGSIEDYAEYKTHFQELCRGEAYTDVIILAQMRQKLPKEALTLIYGLSTPAEAWARLDESYGNTDMQALAALKRLRNFKSGKSSNYDQVVDIANAVQRCVTILRALEREDEFLRDKETMAEVVAMFPIDAQQRWYHRRGDKGATQVDKGRNLLRWVEEERSDAVAMHLDALARRTKPTIATPTAPRSSGPSGGTDQSIYNANHTVRGAGDGVIAAVSQEKEAPATAAGGGRVAVTSEAQAAEVTAKRKRNLEQKKLDKCPMCKRVHEYEKTWTQVVPPVKTKLVSTLLTSCPQFLAQSGDQKMVSLSAHAACPHCTSWEHPRHRFGGRDLPDPKCKVQVAGSECGGPHGKWYHTSGGTTGNVVTGAETTGDSVATPGLFEVHHVDFVSASGEVKRGAVMIDSGSDTDYVRHGFAEELGLQGEPHLCRIKVVDMDYRTVETAKYEMTIMDGSGERHHVNAQGLQSITTLPPDPDLTPLLELLDGVPAAVLDRPQGRIDVLLGLRSSHLHGRDVKDWGNLRLLSTRFGCGWAIRGTHESLQFPGTSSRPSYSAELHAVRNAPLVPPSQFQTFNIITSLGRAAEFHELAELGTTPAPACEKCAGCAECTFRRKKLSREDQEVVSRIEASLKVDEVTGIMSGTYPWKPCVAKMRSNVRQATKIQGSIEKHMLKAGTHSDFVAEVEKSIRDERVRIITDEEMERWHGPVNYVTVFAVLKPGSLSTKTRVVSNSALRNSQAGLSLNDCMYPGPNALADLLDCLLFWRGVESAIMMDLNKAYQAIHTSVMELHLRRFLFRSDPREPWTTYGYTRANFGDLAAGLMLEVGKRRVANLGNEIDPQAAQQLRDKSYVDDSILGGRHSDVRRMRGERTATGYSGTVGRILSRGAMSIKFMAVTGSSDPHEMEQLGGKCLGVCYRIAEDVIFFRLEPCFYDKKLRSSDQARHTIVLGVKDISRLQAGSLFFSRRHALSMVMGLYDPLGLIGPALVTGKLMLRRLYDVEQVSGWDQDVPRGEKQRWASWFASLLASGEAVFPRSTRPENAVGRPRMVGFCDSSEVAVCASLYVVWETLRDGMSSRLLMAKCRVAPLLGMTVPRGEMQALTILTRLLLVVAEAFPEKFLSISSYTDSMCSLGALAKMSTTMKPYFGNRVSEIHHVRARLAELTDDLPPVHHIPGQDNPADIGTRSGVRVDELTLGSLWQTGPAFLREAFETWPVTGDEVRRASAVPPEEIKKEPCDTSRRRRPGRDSHESGVRHHEKTGPDRTTGAEGRLCQGPVQCRGPSDRSRDLREEDCRRGTQEGKAGSIGQDCCTCSPRYCVRRAPVLPGPPSSSVGRACHPVSRQVLVRLGTGGHEARQVARSRGS